MIELPHWEQGTPGVLAVAGPHSIPVSTAVRASGDRMVFALAGGRETLARLRAEPRAAFCLLGPDLAFTAYGETDVLRDEMDCRPHVAAVELRVERVQDHLADGRTEMLAGASWRWRVEEAREDEKAILAELRTLAG